MRHPALKNRPFPPALFAVFALLVLGIFFIGFLSYTHVKSVTERDAEKDLTAIANLKVTEITRWRNERIDDARMAAASLASLGQDLPPLTQSASPEAARKTEEILTLYKNIYRYNHVFLTDTSGTVIAKADSAETRLEEEEKAALSRVLGSGGAVFSDFYRQGKEGEIFLDAAAPVMQGDDKKASFAGVIFLRIYAQEIFPFIQSWPTTSTTAETLLVRKEGENVLFLNELRHRENTALSLHLSAGSGELPAAMAVRGIQGTVKGKDYRGTDVLAAITPVPDSPWYLVAKMDSSEILSPLKARLYTSIFTGIMLIIASLLGILLLWERREARFVLSQSKMESERSRAGEALREREALLSTVFDNLPVGIWILDQRGTIIFGNPAGRKIWAGALYINVEEFGEYKGWKRPSGEPIEPEEWTAARAFRKGESIIDDEIEIACFDGTRKIILDSALPLLDEQGKISGVVVVNQDITERVRIEEKIKKLNEELEERVRERTMELEASNRELDAFAHSVSHDLRSPLRGIDGWSLALIEDYGSALNEEGRQYLMRVRSETQRMGQLIDALLQLSRVTRADISHEKISLSAIASAHMDSLRERDRSRRAVTIIAPGLTVEGDDRLLTIALLNLLDNAWKFTGKCDEALIEVGKEEKSGKTVYFVRDNGAGFDMAYAGKLFAPFQRLHRPSHFPGTGIGLATVKRIITRHGGDIWAESEPEKGSAFFFTLWERP
ncbi:MAG: ATP-binding protein [Candidatus Eremiobacteraeota bacterium]|nr:ATP-binding protein [Candidatus Eremiobacteraeota bacterium]